MTYILSLILKFFLICPSGEGGRDDLSVNLFGQINTGLAWSYSDDIIITDLKSHTYLRVTDWSEASFPPGEYRGASRSHLRWMMWEIAVTRLQTWLCGVFCLPRQIRRSIVGAHKLAECTVVPSSQSSVCFPALGSYNLPSQVSPDRPL